MANGISARNAEKEYEAFVAAHLDSTIPYAKKTGWSFPSNFISRGVCTGPGSLLIDSFTVNHQESCLNPSKIVDDIFQRVLDLIPEKAKEKYLNLILSFKKIGKLKLNRLKENRRFQELCSALSSNKTSKAVRQQSEKEFSLLIKNTMKEILKHIPTCTYKGEFQKFVFFETERQLNNAANVRAAANNLPPPPIGLPAAAANGTGTLVASPVANSLPAAVAVNRNMVATLANDPTAVAATLEPVPVANGTGTLVANSLPPPPIRLPPVTNGTGTPAASPQAANSNNEYVTPVNTGEELGLNVQSMLKQQELAELRNYIREIETSGSNREKAWARNYGYKTLERLINEIKDLENNSNSNTGISSFKKLPLPGLRGGKKSKKTRKHTKKYRKYRKTTRRSH